MRDAARSQVASLPPQTPPLVRTRALVPLAMYELGLGKVEAAVAQERVRLVLNALWALGNIGDHQAIASLSRLRGHADPYVVFNAESALRKLPASPPPVKTN